MTALTTEISTFQRGSSRTLYPGKKWPLHSLENCERRFRLIEIEFPFVFYLSVGNGLNGLPKELVHFPDGAGIYTGSSGLPIHTRLGPMRGRVCAENQVAGALMNFPPELEISWLHCIKAWTVARERDPSFYFYLNMSPSSYHIIPSLFPHTI